MCQTFQKYFYVENITLLLNTVIHCCYCVAMYFKFWFLDQQISGSVVECLTQDIGVVGSSLTGGTVLCP